MLLMSDYLKVIEPDLNPVLFSPKSLVSIRSLADILPISALAGFECRLAADDPRVDFQVLFPAIVNGLPKALLGYPVSENLQSIYQDWISPDCIYNQWVKRVGLEFDLNGLPLPELLPCIFLQLQKNNSVDTLDLIKIINRLAKSDQSELLDTQIRHCVESLPEDAEISHVGGMFSRADNIVRINVKNISLIKTPEYLETIGCLESSNALMTHIPQLSSMIDRVIVSFDIVGGSVSPRVGIECFIDEPFYRNEKPWEVFLDYLSKQNLCSQAKKSSLLDWGRVSPREFDTSIWPSNINWGYHYLASTACLVFERKINHVKLIFQEGKFIEAKGYLAFQSKWIKKDILDRRIKKLAY